MTMRMTTKVFFHHHKRRRMTSQTGGETDDKTKTIPPSTLTIHRRPFHRSCCLSFLFSHLPSSLPNGKCVTSSSSLTFCYSWCSSFSFLVVDDDDDTSNPSNSLFYHPNSSRKMSYGQHTHIRTNNPSTQSSLYPQLHTSTSQQENNNTMEIVDNSRVS